MNLAAQHTKVLIVGAGPSGLMMAAQLLRFGVQPVIIESKQGPSDKSKALAVQARSMEIYRQMGLVDEVLKGGKPSEGLKFFYDGKHHGTFPITDAGQGLTPFPYLFMYPQSKNERVLLGDLTSNTLPVYWDTTLTSFTQSKASVEAVVVTNGASVKITADYLIGADGAHSVVRHSLGIPFNGDTYKHLFYLADIISDTDGDFVSMYLSGEGFAGFFPTPEKNGYRVIGSLHEALKDKTDLGLEDICPIWSV